MRWCGRSGGGEGVIAFSLRRSNAKLCRRRKRGIKAKHTFNLYLLLLLFYFGRSLGTFLNTVILLVWSEGIHLLLLLLLLHLLARLLLIFVYLEMLNTSVTVWKQ